MKKLIKFVRLKNEAYLFDARLYIVKSLVAVLAAYALAIRLPLIHKDLISVLFGLMLTLEPVTVTGIKSGLKQITATLLGAIVTAIIIYIFGISIWTVAISVSATLFICLKINWREVSPVAIFTSIYMTNYIQYTVTGEPSVVLTFWLRILSLGTGVIIAVLFNFIFSLFFYKQMELKRISYSINSIANHLKEIKKGIKECSIESLYQEKIRLRETFAGIDWLTSLVKDKDKETIIKKKMNFPTNRYQTDKYNEVLKALRNMAHLIYDTTYTMINYRNTFNKKQSCAITYRLEELIDECMDLSNLFGRHSDNHDYQDSKDNKETNPLQYKQPLSIQNQRIEDNFNGMKEMMDLIRNNF